MDNIIDKAIINKDDFTFKWKGRARKGLHFGFESQMGVSMDRLYKETENVRYSGSEDSSRS